MTDNTAKTRKHTAAIPSQLLQFAGDGDLLGLYSARELYDVPPSEMLALVERCLRHAHQTDTDVLMGDVASMIMDTAVVELIRLKRIRDRQYARLATADDGELWYAADQLAGHEVQELLYRWSKFAMDTVKSKASVSHLAALANREKAAADDTPNKRNTRPGHNATKQPATHQRRGRKPKSTNGTKPEKATTAKNAKNAKTK